jgi:hypothetical protein
VRGIAQRTILGVDVRPADLKKLYIHPDPT